MEIVVTFRMPPPEHDPPNAEPEAQPTAQPPDADTPHCPIRNVPLQPGEPAYKSEGWWDWYCARVKVAENQSKIKEEERQRKRKQELAMQRAWIAKLRLHREALESGGPRSVDHYTDKNGVVHAYLKPRSLATKCQKGHVEKRMTDAAETLSRRYGAQWDFKYKPAAQIIRSSIRHVVHQRGVTSGNVTVTFDELIPLVSAQIQDEMALCAALGHGVPRDVFYFARDLGLTYPKRGRRPGMKDGTGRASRFKAVEALKAGWRATQETRAAAKAAKKLARGTAKPATPKPVMPVTATPGISDDTAEAPTVIVRVFA